MKYRIKDFSALMLDPNTDTQIVKELIEEFPALLDTGVELTHQCCSYQFASLGIISSTDIGWYIEEGTWKFFTEKEFIHFEEVV